ncbi:MAG: 50S ribosomal protein L24 [Candidatus Diapherotrites archaeon]|nr:50S ribosomal protein L24 [Candidatus Diapherotrites archaeon]
MGKKRSSKPRKQRKAVIEAPLHKRQKLMHANLSKELRKELGKRSFGVRKGDKVKIMRGTYKGKEGKITAVDLKKRKIFIEGIVRKKVDGREIPVGIDPSNVQIIELERSDEKRFKRLKLKVKKVEKKKVARKETEKKIQKKEKKKAKKKSKRKSPNEERKKR